MTKVELSIITKLSFFWIGKLLKVPESSEMYNFHASHATRQKRLNSCRPSCSMQTGLWLLIIFTVLVRCPGFPFFNTKEQMIPPRDRGWWPPLPPTPKIGRGVYTQWSGREKQMVKHIIGEKRDLRMVKSRKYVSWRWQTFIGSMNESLPFKLSNLRKEPCWDFEESCSFQVGNPWNSRLPCLQMPLRSSMLLQRQVLDGIHGRFFNRN